MNESLERRPGTLGRHSRRYAVLAHDQFGKRGAKTAHGVIAYGTDAVVAVIDRAHPGHTVSEIVPYLQCDAPIVASLADALTFAPTALLVGVAPPGGSLPDDWRGEIRAALEHGLEVVNGLHSTFREDIEFAEASRRGGGHIWDVRDPPVDIPLFSGAAWEAPAQVLLTVGSDCAVGKMTVSLELTRAARRTRRNAGFVPTGQTGIMIAGWGIAIDRVISDFAAGAAEQLVCQAARDYDFLVVEGQGSITHPAYAAVTLGLLYGSAPDAMILVHDLSRTDIEGYGTPIASYHKLISTYEGLCATVKPAKVIGIALNTCALNDRDAKRAIEQATAETGLPCSDVVRHGPDDFWNALVPALKAGKTKQLPTVNV